MKASVIISVISGAAFPSRCVESVLSQTVSDLELICVSDSSACVEGSPLTDLANRDSRVVLLKQESTDPGSALNSGIAAAKGDFLYFPDVRGGAMEPDLLERALTRAEETEADIVFFGFFSESPDGARSKTVLFGQTEELFSTGENISFNRTDVPDRLFSISTEALWCKLYRRSFVTGQKLSFPSFPDENGHFFYLTSFASAGKIAYLNLPLYRFRRVNPSPEEYARRNPGSFVEADLVARDWMISREMFDGISLAWQNKVISDTVQVITDPFCPSAIRIGILRDLRDGPMSGTGWLDFPEEAVSDPAAVNTIRWSMSYAIPTYDIHTSAEAENDIRCLTKGKISSPKVSVLMPVYNVGSYLEEALDSVLNQSFRNIEVICINDGSTDGSEKVLLSRAETDLRISVWTQSNRGVSCTRNSCIDLASGEYLYFLDGDDRLVPDALEKLVARAEADRLDILLFFMESFLENGYHAKSNVKTYMEIQRYRLSVLRELNLPPVCTGPELFRTLKDHGVYFCNPVLRLVRRSWLAGQSFRFIPGIVHEDDPHAFAEMINADRVGLLAEPLYQRRLRKNSIMTEDISFHHAYSYAMGAAEMMRLCQAMPENSEFLPVMIAHTRYVLERAQNIYAKLPSMERFAELGISSDRNAYLFRLTVSESIRSDPDLRDDAARDQLTGARESLQEVSARLNETKKKLTFKTDELKTAHKKLRQARNDLADVTCSAEYKLGKKILFLPRRVDAFVRQLKRTR